MKAKKIIRSVKGFMDEKIKAYTAPSEKKVSCANEKVEEISKELEDAKNEVKVITDEWIKFKKEHTEKIKENESIIKEFKEKMEKAKEEVKYSYRQKIAELELATISMKKQIGEYNHEGLEEWERFKHVFTNSMSELGHAVKELAKDVYERRMRTSVSKAGTS